MVGLVVAACSTPVAEAPDAPAPPQPRPVSSDARLAEQMLETGQPLDVIETHIREGLAAAPTDHGLLAALGEVLDRRGRPLEAARHGLRAQSIDPVMPGLRARIATWLEHARMPRAATRWRADLGSDATGPGLPDAFASATPPREALRLEDAPQPDAREQSLHLEVQQGHAFAAFRAVEAADGSWLATVDTHGEVRAWDRETGRLLFVRGNGSASGGIGRLPADDGTRLVTQRGDGAFELRRMPSGVIERRIEAHGGHVLRWAIDETTLQLVALMVRERPSEGTPTDATALIVWNIESGREVVRRGLDLNVSWSPEPYVAVRALEAHAGRVALSVEKRPGLLLDLQTLEPVAVLDDGLVHDVALSETHAVWMTNAAVLAHDLETGRLVALGTDCDRPGFSARLSPDARDVVCETPDGVLAVVDPLDARQPMPLDGAPQLDDQDWYDMQLADGLALLLDLGNMGASYEMQLWRIRGDGGPRRVHAMRAEVTDPRRLETTFATRHSVIAGIIRRHDVTQGPLQHWYVWSGAADEGATLDTPSIEITHLGPGAFVRSPDGRTVAATGARGPRLGPLALWDLQTGAVWRTLPGRFGAVSWFSDSERLVAGMDAGLATWDTLRGERLAVHPTRIPASQVPIRVLEDGSVLFDGSDRWMVRSELENPKPGAPMLDLPAGVVRLDPMTGDVIEHWATDGKYPRALVELATGQLVVGQHERLVLLSPDGGARAGRELLQDPWNVQALAASPAGDVLGVVARDATAGVTRLFVYRFETAARDTPGSDGATPAPPVDTVASDPLPTRAVFDLAFSPDGRELALGSDVITLFDVRAALDEGRGPQAVREIEPGWRKDERTWVVGALGYAGPDRLFAIAQGGFVRLFDTASGDELARLFTFSDGTWAVIDRDGRYDAARGGAIDGLHWVIDGEVVALDQLKSRFYSPGLLAVWLGRSSEPLRPVEALDGVELFPDVEARAADDVPTAVDIALEDRGGGIGRVEVSVNGRLLAGDARGDGFTVDEDGHASLRIDVGGHAALVPGVDNEVQVRVYNEDGYLVSRGTTVRVAAPGERSTTPPRLFGIVVGVSDYSGSSLDLRFAARDAVRFADALEVAATGLFGPDRVQIELLSSERGERPGRGAIADAFEGVTDAATPDDVLVVYFAGHGVELTHRADTYAFLTADARSTELVDPAVEATVAITHDDLMGWLGAVPALKQVLVLDTCAAGALVRAGESRARSSDRIRAIERLKDRTGTFVLMGSAADAVSYEASRFGQGLLTYALLEAMKGGALREDAYVDVGQLFAYAADTVPRLARHIGGIQQPVVSAPGGQSFDIGQLSLDDRQAIPLAAPLPLFVRPVFHDPESIGDPLGLAAAMTHGLRAAGAARDARLVFVDATEMPGAIGVRGQYRHTDAGLEVTLRLWRDGEPIATRELVLEISEHAAISTGAERDTIGAALVDGALEAMPVTE